MTKRQSGCHVPLTKRPMSVHKSFYSQDSIVSCELNTCPLQIDTQSTDKSSSNRDYQATFHSNSTASESVHNQEGNRNGLEGFIISDSYVLRQMRKKIYPKQLPYNQIMSGVIFVMSGIANPRRCRLRDLAIAMGAKYQAKWNRFCTHLICEFKNTLKYKEVMAENGRIVREHWIQECDSKRQLIDWRNYKLGKYPYPDSEEEFDVDDLDYALERSYGIAPTTLNSRSNSTVIANSHLC